MLKPEAFLRTLQTPQNSLQAISRLVASTFPLLIFFAAFLPRTIYLVARSTIWHVRAIEFIQAVSQGNWQGTLLAPHPGVMTVWLAGIAHWLGSTFVPDFDHQPLDSQMSVELVPLGIVISLSIVGAYFLLARLFDRQVAIVAAMLIALDPFHIFVSKTLHVDALMSVFVMISALLILVFIGSPVSGQKRYMALSGIFAGLALLTKTPALFLVPYLLLCLFAWQFGSILVSRDGQLSLHFERSDWVGAVRRIFIVAAIWFLAASVTYFLLWPSMWIQPIETLSSSFGQTLRFSETAHPSPLYFLGQVTFDDPGPLFYPINMLIKTTAITLPFFLISLFFLFSRKLEQGTRLSLILLLAFVLFFTMQMTVSDKKFARYALPAMQFVIIMAGFGAVYFFRRLARGRLWLLYLSLFLVVFVQFAISIARHPYYGTHYNRLLSAPGRILENGIVAGQEQGEGLDIAADYLNDLPLSPLLVVGVQNAESFGRYFQGKTVPMTDEEVDYLVFARNWVVRGMEDWKWRSLWDKYQERRPKLVVEYDEVPYVWVYKVGPEIGDQTIKNKLDVDVGGDIRLLGYDLEPVKAAPGQSVLLTLYWEAKRDPSDDYTVFTHLLDPEGQLQSQRDSPPQAGTYPTYLWDEGERVEDQYELTVPPHAPAGEYEIAVGMYTLQDLERLPVIAPDGQQLLDRRILIRGLEVVSSGE